MFINHVATKRSVLQPHHLLPDFWGHIKYHLAPPLRRRSQDISHVTPAAASPHPLVFLSIDGALSLPSPSRPPARWHLPSVGVRAVCLEQGSSDPSLARQPACV